MSAESNPSHKGLRVAELIKSGEGQAAAIERAPGVYESRGVGNSYLLTTSEGDVLVNAGALRDAKRGRALFGKVSSRPIRYIILTQSHANQYGGLETVQDAGQHGHRPPQLSRGSTLQRGVEYALPAWLEENIRRDHGIGAGHRPDRGGAARPPDRRTARVRAGRSALRDSLDSRRRDALRCDRLAAEREDRGHRQSVRADLRQSAEPQHHPRRQAALGAAVHRVDQEAARARARARTDRPRRDSRYGAHPARGDTDHRRRAVDSRPHDRGHERRHQLAQLDA